MYDCSFSEWTAVKMGPRRDVIGELDQAVRQAGLVFGLSSHRAEHWWFFDGGRHFPSDVQDPRWAGLYGPARPKDTQPDGAFLADWLARTQELVDKYQPHLIYFDWWIEEPGFAPYLPQFAAYYYNRAREWQRGVVINYKHRAFPEEAAVLDIERGQLAAIRPLCWQTCTAVARNSWGYVAQPHYKMPGELIGDLADIVSKNGALLLNIGPRADGTIPDEDTAILRAIGGWLAVNGEAIYETRPWETFGEGPRRSRSAPSRTPSGPTLRAGTFASPHGRTRCMRSAWARRRAPSPSSRSAPGRPSRRSALSQSACWDRPSHWPGRRARRD
jgi:alpha-L-fucosidase